MFISQLTKGDIPEISILLTESVDFHHPWVSYPHTASDLENYFTDTGPEGTILFLVGLKSSGKFIGVMNLSRFAMGVWRTCECGCAVGVRHSGHGYLAEALRLLVRHAMSKLGMRRIEALVDPENVPSQRMLEAVGFRSEGVARSAIGDGDQRFDQIRWAITAGDITGGIHIEGR
ncbi:GNAT family N-acetyltransferase [Amycolatopsis sp. NBC_01286]|uniref:GNAT family N-acetyltransferase n=1 Tax=Amycolatopsis sp. NBC_01286 TaxID=2903560 RepID=UPI002E0D2530|nr:GNAT family N-acetyltransferase [Amycolatopsis sp. NBC_01286]